MMEVARVMGRYVFLFFGFLNTVGCGSSENIFFEINNPSNEQRARAALNHGDLKGAIQYLKLALKKDPGNHKLSTLLASLELKSAGLDELQLASQFLGSGGTVDISQAISSLPEGTEENANKLRSAISALSAIPADQRTTAQNYQMGMAQVTLATTILKQNANGAPIDQNTPISDAAADEILTNLASAGQSFQGSGGTGQDFTKLSEVSNSPGATSADKLRNFFGSTKAN